MHYYIRTTSTTSTTTSTTTTLSAVTINIALSTPTLPTIAGYNIINWEDWHAQINGWNFENLAGHSYITWISGWTTTTGGTVSWSLALDYGGFQPAGEDVSTGNMYAPTYFDRNALSIGYYIPNPTGNILIRGLNPAKTYTVRTGHYSSDSGTVSMTVGSTTHTGEQNNWDGSKHTPLELTFTSISPAGNGSLLLALTPQFIRINALSITENP